MSWNGTVRCGECYGKGHNKRSCPDRAKAMEIRRKLDPDCWQVKEYDAERQNGRKRSCKYCKESGHNKATCKSLITDQITAREKCSEWRTGALKAIEAMGLGVGALVAVDGKPALVMGIKWNNGCNLYVDNYNRAQSMIEIKGSRTYNTFCPFPNHPELAPRSPVNLVAPAPGESFARTVPDNWVQEEPPSRIMRQFDPECW